MMMMMNDDIESGKDEVLGQVKRKYMLDFQVNVQRENRC